MRPFRTMKISDLFCKDKEQLSPQVKPLNLASIPEVPIWIYGRVATGPITRAPLEFAIGSQNLSFG
jgi:hypothetical protein